MFTPEPAAAIPRVGALLDGTAPLRPGEAPTEGLTLVELVPPAAVNLRGDPADPRFARKVGAALGCVLPISPNSVQTAAEVTVLWLGPDEWLVLAEPGRDASLVQELVAALDGVPSSVVDVSGNRARLRLAGPGAREVLAKGCPLDLHPRAMKPGDCAQTVLARTAVILHQVDDRPCYDLYPRRSFAPYLAAWLRDAMGRGLPRASVS